MYANMSNQEKFLNHIVNDSRSFKNENFDKAVKIINNPKKGVDIDQDRKELFEKMVIKIKQMKQDLDDEEVSTKYSFIIQGLYDDAPEEFLDTLMSTLMKDPVELPSSRNIVDYMTISKSFDVYYLEKHLMNEPNDPFNRSPLTIDQLVPRNDLKQRIEEYKESKRKANKK